MWGSGRHAGYTWFIMSKECRQAAATQSHQRHNLARFEQGKIQSVKEPTGLTRTDGKRPDGLTLIPWSQGRCLTWDVTVPDTLAASHLNRTSVIAGAAAEHAAELKIAKYSDLIPHYDFVAIAVETLGSWSDNALMFVKTLGKRLTEATGDSQETVYLLQRLSVAIQRCNAICFDASFKPASALQ